MIHSVTTRPKDYHCWCVYCANFYRGELIKTDGSYYSARERVGYSPYEKKHKHLDKGHWQGFAFCVEQYTKPGELVFDPMAGSGTAMVEALKRARAAAGIELEYFDILCANTDIYDGGFGISRFKGDARQQIDEFQGYNFDLVVTGPVYNNNSDAPERKILKGKDSSFNYDKNLPNLAWLDDEEYYDEFKKLYLKVIENMRPGGKFAIIIKDPMRYKKPYLLHTHFAVILRELGLKPLDVWIHRHYPPTLFINTYKKKFPDADVPLYQTIVVFEKS